MAYITTKQALEWIAEEKGRSVSSSRKELLGLLNDARRLFYSVYQKIRLDVHVELCFVVKEFYEPCVGECCDTAKYNGITLPAEVKQVEAIWMGTTPITIYNRWFEYEDGVQGRGSPLKAIDAGNDFPLQTDWSPSRCIKPVFMLTDAADNNKVLHIKFTNANGEERMEKVTLCTAGSSTTSEVRQVSRPAGIVLPSDLVGGIEVYDSLGGGSLGFLHPKITIPSFRRLKITDSKPGDIIRVRGLRRYTDVAFDWEAIETDNKLAILEALRYLSIMSVNSSDAQWIAKARMHMENVITYLGGDNLADEGPTVVRHLDFVKMPLRKSGLRARRARAR